MSEYYQDLTLEQALARREAVQEQYWDIVDLLGANRADYGEISRYIFKLIQEQCRE